MNPLLRMILGGLAGAAIGFAMYKFVGCKTGACPLTANPYMAMVIWGLMGVMMTAGR